MSARRRVAMIAALAAAAVPLLSAAPASAQWFSSQMKGGANSTYGCDRTRRSCG